MRKCKKKKVKKWSAVKIAGKHVLKWTGFYRGANAQTRKLCARHNRWTQFATTITAFKEHKRTHRIWIKNIVQHNHNYDDDDGDGDDDNQAVRPLCTSLALSLRLAFVKIKQTWTIIISCKFHLFWCLLSHHRHIFFLGTISVENHQIAMLWSTKWAQYLISIVNFSELHFAFIIIIIIKRIFCMDHFFLPFILHRCRNI